MVENPSYVDFKMIESQNGTPLDTLYISNPDSNKCVILFHGNAGNISMHYNMIKFFYQFCNVVIFDYQTYGRSTGVNANANSNNFLQDSLAIWNYATQQLGYSADRISLVGESLGCSIAIRLASELSKQFDEKCYPHSLILISPFYSLESMISRVITRIGLASISRIVTKIIRNDYPSNEWVQYVSHNTRILIAHSKKDEIVPFQEGKQLYELISPNHPQVNFIVLDGTHNNLTLTDEYIYQLADIYGR